MARPRYKVSMQKCRWFTYLTCIASPVLFFSCMFSFQPTHTSHIPERVSLVPSVAVNSTSVQVYTFSAFFDTRPSLLDKIPVIRINTLLQKEAAITRITCHVRTNQGVVSLPGTPHFLDEAYFKRKYMYAAIVCPVVDGNMYDLLQKPKQSDAGHPCVTLGFPGSSLENDVCVAIHALPPMESALIANSISICVPAVRGDAYAASLRHWVGTYKEMGVSTIIMYNLSASGVTSSEMVALASSGAVKIVQLEFLSDTHRTHFSAETHMHAQSLLIHDCLLRNVGYSRWVGFLDMDEFILGRSPGMTTLHKIISTSIETEGAGNLIVNATYRPAVALDPAQSPQQPPAAVLFYHAFFRANCLPHVPRHLADHHRLPNRQSAPPFLHSFIREEFNGAFFRTKAFIDPIAVVEHGIHYPCGCLASHMDAIRGTRGRAGAQHVIHAPLRIAALQHHRFYGPGGTTVEVCPIGNGTYIEDYTAADVWLHAHGV